MSDNPEGQSDYAEMQEIIDNVADAVVSGEVTYEQATDYLMSLGLDANLDDAIADAESGE